MNKTTTIEISDFIGSLKQPMDQANELNQLLLLPTTKAKIFETMYPLEVARMVAQMVASGYQSPVDMKARPEQASQQDSDRAERFTLAYHKFTAAICEYISEVTATDTDPQYFDNVVSSLGVGAAAGFDTLSEPCPSPSQLLTDDLQFIKKSVGMLGRKGKSLKDALIAYEHFIVRAQQLIKLSKSYYAFACNKREELLQLINSVAPGAIAINETLPALVKRVETAVEVHMQSNLAANSTQCPPLPAAKLIGFLNHIGAEKLKQIRGSMREQVAKYCHMVTALDNCHYLAEIFK